MDKVKGVAKGGWHPQGKFTKKESWRGDFKGINQVASLVGKGKSFDTSETPHQSRPIAALKDPSAFGPPPKNVNYHGGAAVPNAITPDRRGLGAPLEIPPAYQVVEGPRVAESDVQKPPTPPVPYRVDTTGLSTVNLPKPPVRSGHQDVTPGSYSIESKRPKPALPPRLPPRQNSAVSNNGPSSPVADSPTTKEVAAPRSYLNQGAVSRLGSAGVSVPGFGIGASSETANPWRDMPGSNAADRTLGTNELQSRFSRMSTTSTPDSPSQGTTFAEKQAALRTASSFRNDPSSLSLSDAKAAASTANNFRERHGDQVAAGWQGANGLNKKYGIATKMSGYVSDAGASPTHGIPSSPTSPNPWNSSSSQTFKKPPPPPPPSKNLLGEGMSDRTPPPVPLASKPRS